MTLYERTGAVEVLKKTPFVAAVQTDIDGTTANGRLHKLTGFTNDPD